MYNIVRKKDTRFTQVRFWAHPDGCQCLNLVVQFTIKWSVQLFIDNSAQSCLRVGWQSVYWKKIEERKDKIFRF